MTATTTLAHTPASSIPSSLRASSGHATPHGSRSNTPVRIKRVLPAQLDVASAPSVPDFDVADDASRFVRRSCSAHALDSAHALHLPSTGRRRRLSVTAFNEPNTPAPTCREESSSIIGDVLARRQLGDAPREQQLVPAEDASSSTLILSAQMSLGEYAVLGPDACVALASNLIADPAVQCLVVTAPGATHILSKEDVARLARYSRDPQVDTLGSFLAGTSLAPSLYQSASLAAAAGLLLERPDAQFAAVIEDSGNAGFLGLVSRTDLARALLGDRSCVYSVPCSAATTPSGAGAGAGATAVAVAAAVVAPATTPAAAVLAAAAGAAPAVAATGATSGTVGEASGEAVNGHSHQRHDLLSYQLATASPGGVQAGAAVPRLPMPPPLPPPPPASTLHRQISASRQAVLAALACAPARGQGAGPAAALAAAAAAVSSGPQMVLDAASRMCGGLGSAAMAAEAGIGPGSQLLPSAPPPSLPEIPASGPHQLHFAAHRLSRISDPYPRPSEAPPLGQQLPQQSALQPEQVLRGAELSYGVPQLRNGDASPHANGSLDHPPLAVESMRSFSDPIRSGWDVLDNMDDALDVLGMVGKTVNAEAVGRKLFGDVLGAAANIAGGSSGTGWLFKYMYDGDCSICRTFQAMLEKMDNGVGRVMFVDISQNFNPIEHGGINYRAAMETIHILSANGQVFKGVTAVIKLLAAVDPEIAANLGVVTAALPLLSLGYMVVSKNRHHLSKVWANVLRVTKADQVLFGRDILGPDFGAPQVGSRVGLGSRFAPEAVKAVADRAPGPVGMAGSSLRAGSDAAGGVGAGAQGALRSHQLQTQPST